MTAIQFRENLPDMTEVGTDSEEPYKVDKGLDQVLRRSVVFAYEHLVKFVFLRDLLQIHCNGSCPLDRDGTPQETFTAAVIMVLSV